LSDDPREIGVVMADEILKNINRRSFLKNGIHTASALAMGGLAGSLLGSSTKDNLVWQIDPEICVQCERCSTNCVLSPSAVKCVHAFSMCGYCDLCGGYLEPDAASRDTAAEHQLCPTSAIRRRFVEDPYFEYKIDEILCIGCGKCVKGCGMFGNGSLFLQVRHDRCVNCNECSIAKSCPSGAMKRIPASQAYLLRGDIKNLLDKKSG
jgi:Na+-translocating ferredoxin:NAD+ oxidoreductase subunit B